VSWTTKIRGGHILSIVVTLEKGKGRDDIRWSGWALFLGWEVRVQHPDRYYEFERDNKNVRVRWSGGRWLKWTGQGTNAKKAVYPRLIDALVSDTDYYPGYYKAPPE
jgi:hypothetical protein